MIDNGITFSSDQHVPIYPNSQFISMGFTFLKSKSRDKKDIEVKLFESLCAI